MPDRDGYLPLRARANRVWLAALAFVIGELLTLGAVVFWLATWHDPVGRFTWQSDTSIRIRNAVGIPLLTFCAIVIAQQFWIALGRIPLAGFRRLEDGAVEVRQRRILGFQWREKITVLDRPTSARWYDRRDKAALWSTWYARILSARGATTKVRVVSFTRWHPADRAAIGSLLAPQHPEDSSS